MNPKAKFIPNKIKIEIPSQAITCPFCKVKSHFTAIEKSSTFRFEKGVFSILECDNCNEIIFTVYKWKKSYRMEYPNTGVPVLEDEPTKIYPKIWPNDERVYQKGDAYDFYKDIRNIIRSVKKEIFIIDAYANEEMLNLYLEKLPSNIKTRILTKKPQGNFITVATKFKQKLEVNFEVRKNSDCHDRLLFTDNECWVFGQSISHAGEKPTYLLHIKSYDLFKKVFEDLWKNSKSLI